MMFNAKYDSDRKILFAFYFANKLSVHISPRTARIADKDMKMLRRTNNVRYYYYTYIFFKMKIVIIPWN